MSMQSIVAKVNGRVDTTIRKATIELFSAVIKGTPVDTGRARANWQCTIGSPHTEEVQKTDKEGSSSIADVKATVPSKSGQVVWLANNVPYIQKLEYGSSQQAPAGMVRININRFAGILREA